jgi:hypothetical protein
MKKQGLHSAFRHYFAKKSNKSTMGIYETNICDFYAFDEIKFDKAWVPLKTTLALAPLVGLLLWSRWNRFEKRLVK